MVNVSTSSDSTAPVNGGRGRLVSFSAGIFGRVYRNDSFPRMLRDLRTSRFPYTVSEYLSTVTLASILFGAALTVFTALISLENLHLAFLIMALDFLGIVVFVMILLEIPATVSKRRRRDINAKLPIAIAFVATLASAEVSIDEIMRELGEAREFGEISREAAAISFSTRMFGKDIVTAVWDASRISPSTRLADFLQGITTTVTTGGDLKQYFTTKSRDYYGEQENEIRKNSQSVGIMGESYITVGVAFPLILMIILGVVGALSPSTHSSIIVVLYAIGLVMIPAIAGFFIYLLRSTLLEVDT